MKTFLFRSGLGVILSGIIISIIYLAIRLPGSLDLQRFAVVVYALAILGISLALGILLLIVSLFVPD
ncbi:hypothetical protein KDW_20590 [Dictyobacter vulcani]|uniref:Uncharacterized protein n=1 Tax=Dictyobacter vulcani TaxID=2607529 RepID=A0A5J4KN84_9CHLR|nr:hypothetical protein KDW_20590 [Dictyobacter vulcani]